MKKKYVRYISVLVLAIGFNIRCGLHLLFNLITLKHLRVKTVFFCDWYVIVGNDVTLTWDIQGCHKIHISGFGSFSGKTQGLRIKIQKVPLHLVIRFYGIGKFIQKEISISGELVNSTTTFMIELRKMSEPVLSAFNLNLDNSIQKFKFTQLDHVRQNKSTPLSFTCPQFNPSEYNNPQLNHYD